VKLVTSVHDSLISFVSGCFFSYTTQAFSLATKKRLVCCINPAHMIQPNSLDFLARVQRKVCSFTNSTIWC